MLQKKAVPEAAGVTFWRCDLRNQGCKSRIRVSRENVVLRVSSGHNHRPSGPRPVAQKASHAMKHQAQNTDNILTANTNAAVLSDAARAHLPADQSIKRNIAHQRNWALDLPAHPQALEDFHTVPTAFAEFRDGAPFVMFNPVVLPISGTLSSLVFSMS